MIALKLSPKVWRRSHLPDVYNTTSAGSGTFPFKNRGCRGFIGPFPPPLWIRVPVNLVVKVKISKNIAQNYNIHKHFDGVS